VRRVCRFDGQEDLYLFHLRYYGTQGRAGAGVSVGAELDRRAIVYWRSECGGLAKGRGICGTRYVGGGFAFVTPVNDDGQGFSRDVGRSVRSVKW
jgi:hypothetical protein